jgi:dGTPase
MFRNVYTNPKAKSEESKAERMIMELYTYYTGHMDKLPVEFQELAKRYGDEQAVCDYIAGMTDSYAISRFQEIYIPKSWSV